MNKIEKLLLRGAGYGILFILIYFALAAMMGFEGIHITAGRFFLILLFAYILAMADFLFESVERMNLWLKRLCVYAISLLAFLFIFVLGEGMRKGAAAIFAALIIFTAVYAVLLGVILLIKATVKGGASKPTKKAKAKPEKKEEKKPYKSLYED